MDSFAIQLDNFSGPLDLLLHLIKKHEMEITDIPIADITDQYLTVIDTIQSLNLDMAGEFLLMAATLLHIKSRMLLPQVTVDGDDEEADDEDPRAELVRRLLEYQKYKDAAARLDELPQLNRDLYARSGPAPEVVEKGEEEFVAIGLYDLLQALQELLKVRPEPLVHQVMTEQLSVADCISRILVSLQGQQSLSFAELFPAHVVRAEVIVTFLALLELVKMRLVRLLQSQRFGTIWLTPAVEEPLAPLGCDEEALGYA